MSHTQRKPPPRQTQAPRPLPVSTMQLNLPHLQATPTSKQLIVNGEPFLLLAAELQNSSFTSAKYMREIWPNLVQAKVNTVLGCVTWEQIEPVEGEFHFEELDQCIRDARQHGLRLVLLWFGSFKNALSSYAPSWVKKDSKRFPRAKLRKAGGILQVADTVSIFHKEAQAADARAFAEFMTHLREVDQKHSTVIMVQVENEPGLLGDSRDGSAAAKKLFHEPVPTVLLDKIRNEWDNLRPELRSTVKDCQKSVSGSWQDVFGKTKKTDELFMAYHFALYIEQVAAAGKKAYPIPLFTNVWQNYGDNQDANFPTVAGGGSDPGDYPSGGGIIDVLDIWQIFAPSLDFIAPDIYLNDYDSTCAKYRHRNQPLLVPEQRRDEYGARRIWKAIGSHHALGTSPFGIDTLEPASNPFKRHYGLLAQVSKQVLQAQRDGMCEGFFFDELPVEKRGMDSSPPTRVKFGPWNLLIERSFVFGHPDAGAGMVIYRGGARFLLVGWGFQVTFRHESAPFTGILNFLEKEVQNDGTLKTLRMLNGDETRSGASCVMPSEDPDYGGFPISITIPARTMIAEVNVYSLDDD